MLKIGSWVVDADSNTIKGPTGEEHIEPKLMDLLVYLASRAGEVVSRDEIVEHVWQRAFASDQAITNAVARLRKLLGDSASDPKILETIPKKGYRLIAQVERAPEHKPVATLRAIGVAGAAAGIMAVAGLTWWFAQGQPTQQYPISDQIFASSLIGEEANPAFSPNGRFLAFANLPEAQARWRIHVYDRLDNKTRLLVSSDFDDQYPVWSPAGDRIIFHRWAKGFCAIMELPVSEHARPAGEAKLLLQCDPSSVSISMDFSPDGEKIYFTDGESATSPYQIFRYDLSTTARVQITNPPAEGRGDYRLAVSADGSHLAFLRNRRWFDTEIRRLNLVNWQEESVGEFKWVYHDVAWGLNNDLLLANPDGSLVAWETRDRRFLTLRPMIHRTFSPTLAADGSRIAFVFGESAVSDLWQVALDADRTPERLAASTRKERTPAFSHRGDRLAFVSDRSGLPQIWLRGPESQLRQLTRFEQYSVPSRLAWSPDDRWILSNQNGRIYRVSLETGDVEFLTQDSIFASQPTWATNRLVLFTSEQSGDWQIWGVDVTTKSTRMVTQNGGYGGVADQTHVYFTKYHQSGIWRATLNGNEEVQLVPDINRLSWATLQLVADRLYFALADSREIQSIALDTGLRGSVLERSDRAHLPFSVHPDESLVVFAENESFDSQVVAFQ